MKLTKEKKNSWDPITEFIKKLIISFNSKSFVSATFSFFDEIEEEYYVVVGKSDGTDLSTRYNECCDSLQEIVNKIGNAKDVDLQYIKDIAETVLDKRLNS